MMALLFSDEGMSFEGHVLGGRVWQLVLTIMLFTLF
jgi:hypothetical protein